MAARAAASCPFLLLLQRRDGVAQDGRVGLQGGAHHRRSPPAAPAWSRPPQAGAAVRPSSRARPAGSETCAASVSSGSWGVVARAAQRGEPGGDEQRLPVLTNESMAASLGRMLRTSLSLQAGRAEQGVGTGAQQRLGFRVPDDDRAGPPCASPPASSAVGLARPSWRHVAVVLALNCIPAATTHGHQCHDRRWRTRAGHAGLCERLPGRRRGRRAAGGAGGARGAVAPAARRRTRRWRSASC